MMTIIYILYVDNSFNLD